MTPVRESVKSMRADLSAITHRIRFHTLNWCVLRKSAAVCLHQQPYRISNSSNQQKENIASTMNCALLYPALPAFSNNRPCISHNYDCYSHSILSQLFNFDIGVAPYFQEGILCVYFLLCEPRNHGYHIVPTRPRYSCPRNRVVLFRSNSMSSNSVLCVVKTICAPFGLVFLLWNLAMTNSTKAGCSSFFYTIYQQKPTFGQYRFNRGSKRHQFSGAVRFIGKFHRINTGFSDFYLCLGVLILPLDSFPNHWKALKAIA